VRTLPDHPALGRKASLRKPPHAADKAAVNAPLRLNLASLPLWSPDDTAPSSGIARMQVVIIDDDPDIATLLAHLLRQLGTPTVQSFSDAELALEWCRAHAPDLVFLDYRLPHRDGLQFLEEFMRLPGATEIPVVMLTASEDRAVRHSALLAGASDFITKPIDQTELIARSANLLALRSRTRQLRRRAGWLEEETRRASEQLMRREEEMLFSLGRAAEFRDPETGAHIQRMSHYSQIISRELGMPKERQEIILRAAPMHDVGKLGTPDHILLKPGKLTPEEFEVMKQHARHGYEILKLSRSPVLQVAATIAHSHHEKWDGSGYPRALRGNAIPLEGRIVAVADVFDALTSARPYKQAWEVERAVQFLREQSGKHFDPVCLEAFFSAWSAVLQIRQEHADVAPPADSPAALAARYAA
jgi:putative two-component system response regulator